MKEVMGGEGPQAMIGLKRHTVRVVDHEPGWALLFDAEAEGIREHLGGLAADIQHVGSTAAPGLPAKPILDLAVALDTLDELPFVVERLTGAGYLYRGDAGADGGHLFVKESELGVRTVHLHVVDRDDEQWRNYLLFRDILRGEESVRLRYSALKRALAAQHGDDRRSYTESKNEFIREVLRKERIPGGAMSTARVFQINTSDGHVPKYPVPQATITAEGVAGDRQNDLKNHGGPDRAVCLFSLECIMRLQEEGHPVFPGATGENLTISGLPWKEIEPGVRLHLGSEVCVEITSFTSPCGKIKESFADGDFGRISQESNPGWSRVYARVLNPGTVKIGEVVSASKPVAADA